jgi:hypothetical protein
LNASVERQRRLLNIRLPGTAGMVFSVADIIPKRGLLATKLALCHDESTSSAMTEPDHTL